MSGLPLYLGMTRQHLLDTYGNPDADGDSILDLSWAQENLRVFTLPFPMRLSWSPDTVISKFQAHIRAGVRIQDALEAMKKDVGLTYIQEKRLDRWGGCFNFRPKRGGSSLSTHSWGIAVDINPDLGRFRNLEDKAVYPQFIVTAFKANGFEWGGNWAADNVDSMHFQLKE